jgi:hypothetical protein
LHQGQIVAQGTPAQLKAGRAGATLDEVFLALTDPEDDPQSALDARFTAKEALR